MIDPKTKTENEGANTGGSEIPVPTAQTEEIGGRKGLDPTRFGDWEIGGKCVDF